MSLFRRKNSLKNRVRSLEDTLGLFYVKPDSKDDYPDHKLEEGGYEIIPKLKKAVDELQKGKK